MSQIRFTKEHEWVRLDGDVAVCGITDFAQHALGDIVYVELPLVGKKVTQGSEAAVIESAKAASEIYAPVDGDVVAANENLSGDPAQVNKAAMGDGWIFKLKPTNTAQLDVMMDETAYKTYIESL